MAVLRGSGEKHMACPGTGWNNMQGRHQLHTWPFQALSYKNCGGNSLKNTFLQIFQPFLLTAVKCNTSKAHGVAAGDGCPWCPGWEVSCLLLQGPCWGFPHLCPPAHWIGGRSWESLWTVSQALRHPETFHSAQQIGRIEQKAALGLPAAKAL